MSMLMCSLILSKILDFTIICDIILPHFNLSISNLYFIVAKIALIISAHFYLSYSCFMIIFISFNLKYIFLIHFTIAK